MVTAQRCEVNMFDCEKHGRKAPDHTHLKMEDYGNDAEYIVLDCQTNDKYERS